MVKEIFISKLNSLAARIKRDYGIKTWFVEIMGRRHSYLAGDKDDSFLPVNSYFITETLAIVSNEWQKISQEKVEEILKLTQREILECLEHLKVKECT